LLIFDIGAHDGKDTAYYLRLGCDVVAVEANPELAGGLMGQFSREIAAGRLSVVNRAIHSESGQVSFLVNKTNSEWSSTDPAFGARDSTDYQEIIVPCIRFTELIEQYSVPDYVKLDIEGADRYALGDLHVNSIRPPHISVELHAANYLAILYAIGYRQFKLVNQGLYYSWKDPRLRDHVFRIGSSGPFGELAAGRWLEFDEICGLYVQTKQIQVQHPYLLDAWFDVHAK